MVRSKLLLLALAALTAGAACQTDEPTSSTPTLGPGEGLTLDEDDCVAPDPSRGEGAWREVACEDPAALGRVTERQQDVPGMAGALSQHDCPGDSDLALDVSRMAGGSPARGFACVRHLRPPHPGDPGEGGGAGFVFDDCAALVGDRVEETRCDGAGEHPADFRITDVGRFGCPPGTDLSFRVGGNLVLPGSSDSRVVCAEALTPQAAAAARAAAENEPGLAAPGPPPMDIPSPTLSPEVLDKVLRPSSTG